MNGDEGVVQGGGERSVRLATREAPAASGRGVNLVRAALGPGWWRRGTRVVVIAAVVGLVHELLHLLLGRALELLAISAILSSSAGIVLAELAAMKMEKWVDSTWEKRDPPPRPRKILEDGIIEFQRQLDRAAQRARDPDVGSWEEWDRRGDLTDAEPAIRELADIHERLDEIKGIVDTFSA